MKYLLTAILIAFTSYLNAQEYAPVTGDEVLKSNYLTNRSADSALTHLSKYLAKYGSFVELSNKKAGSVQSLEFVSSNQGDAARSNKLKVNALVKDGVIQEIEINGFIGHVFNLFKGYWQTDFDTVIEKPTTLFRKYGDEYLVFRSYGGSTNYARILITAKPKEIASK